MPVLVCCARHVLCLFWCLRKICLCMLILRFCLGGSLWRVRACSRVFFLSLGVSALGPSFGKVLGLPSGLVLVWRVVCLGAAPPAPSYLRAISFALFKNSDRPFSSQYSMNGCVTYPSGSTKAFNDSHVLAERGYPSHSVTNLQRCENLCL